ncbi:hypothetical protein [Streptomyces sp. NPDC017230]|uniref:hypothetical protein n=1 Tax=unclassified Streptomyces TaxID=2593676 RepID=UPI0037B91231
MQRAKNIFFAAGRRVAKGELFADDDPILKGRQALFEPVDEPEPAKPPAKKTAAKKPAG